MTRQVRPTLSVGQGSSFNWALRAEDPSFDGTEIVTCDIKIADVGGVVPDSSNPAVLSVTPVFVEADTVTDAHYHFFVSDEESASLPIALLVTDARVVMGPNSVVYPDPILIQVNRVVTGS